MSDPQTQSQFDDEDDMYQMGSSQFDDDFGSQPLDDQDESGLVFDDDPPSTTATTDTFETERLDNVSYAVFDKKRATDSSDPVTQSQATQDDSQLAHMMSARSYASQSQTQSQEVSLDEEVFHDTNEDDSFSGDGVVGDDTAIEFEESNPVLDEMEEYEEDENEELAFMEDDEAPEYDFNNLPSHACAYCGIHNPKTVARCDVCNKWFCNTPGSSAGAHVVHHLVRSKHKHISLHAQSALGESALECFNCGNRNIFVLGFLPSTTESVVVVLCREQCLHAPNIKEMDWDASAWHPLIRDRALLDWLVSQPSEQEKNKARNISGEDMSKLEDLWKTKAHARFEDLYVEHVSDEVDSVLIHYDDAQHFQRIYSPLVQLEADFDQKMKEAQTQENVNVRWDRSLGGKRQLCFRLNRGRSENELRVVCGDELCVKYAGDGKNDKWECYGNVAKIDDLTEEIVLELCGKGLLSKSHNGMNNAPNGKPGGKRISKKPHHTSYSSRKWTDIDENDAPTDQTSGFIVEFVWKSTSFDRMQTAMKTLINDDYSLSAYLYHKLMGHDILSQNLSLEISKVISAPNLPKLNTSQTEAVRHCLREPLSLIQGPPGTGKTVTSGTIVYHLAKNSRMNGQVLVSAPSNIAVDQLTMKIHQTGLKVVRLCAKSRESVASDVEFLALHNLVIQVAQLENSELHKWHTLKEEIGELNPDDNARYRRLLRSTEKKLLRSADVICATCVGCGDPRLKDFRFTRVLIDESTQATEPEVLIPIVMGAKQVVLVGDHCQLGPVIMCKQAANAGLQRSLFERLILLQITPVRLQVQYRMHPCLAEFASNTFYEGTLQNGVTTQQRTDDRMGMFWPNPNTPMFFLASMGREEFSASGTSYLNRTEAQNVEKTVTNMIKLGVKPVQIGVITPYEGQRSYIVSYMSRQGTLSNSEYESIEVASVDAFQGREKDYIILSTVRSNEHQGIGFLNDPRRLNVALTRARYGLVIVGNPSVLSRQVLWNNLIQHFQLLGLLVEGQLASLKQCVLPMGESRKYYNAHLTLMPQRRPVVQPRTYGDKLPRHLRATQVHPNHNGNHHGHSSVYDRQEIALGRRDLDSSETPLRTQDYTQMGTGDLSGSVTMSQEMSAMAMHSIAPITQSQTQTYAFPGMITPAHLNARATPMDDMMGAPITQSQSQSQTYDFNTQSQTQEI